MDPEHTSRHCPLPHISSNSLHATCCISIFAAASDTSSHITAGTTSVASTRVATNFLHIHMTLRQNNVMQANLTLPLRFWLDEYAFTPGETTLLKEEIEVRASKRL